MATEQAKILIVDDMQENVAILSAILKPFYRRSVSLDGKKALEIANSDDPPDLVLLDINMPGLDGYEVCKGLKDNPATRNIPVIFITSMDEVADEARGFEVGAVDYIIKPVSPPLVLARVRTHLELKQARDRLSHQNVILEEKVRERTREVSIQGLASLAETRDNETGAHIRRTQHYVRALAQSLSGHPSFSHYLDDHTVTLLYRPAPLHDIGKVGVRDAILLKPGKLTLEEFEEFEEMKKHTVYGKEALERAGQTFMVQGSISFLRLAREIAYSHHEKWDGGGYPRGIKGDDIPISGRMMALADVYDALISRRVYKRPFPHSKAVGVSLEGRGSHFDPLLIDAFTDIQEDFRRIALEFADFPEEREILMQ
ncbi:MAG: HD domain-containing phosphohydrolase [Pseudomonadota bacterium]